MTGWGGERVGMAPAFAGDSGAGDSEEGDALSQRERGFCLGEWAREAGWVRC